MQDNTIKPAGQEVPQVRRAKREQGAAEKPETPAETLNANLQEGLEKMFPAAAKAEVEGAVVQSDLGKTLTSMTQAVEKFSKDPEIEKMLENPETKEKLAAAKTFTEKVGVMEEALKSNPELLAKLESELLAKETSALNRLEISALNRERWGEGPLGYLALAALVFIVFNKNWGIRIPSWSNTKK